MSAKREKIMNYFNLVIGIAMVATGLLLFAGVRGLKTGSIAKNKAYLMIAVAIVTVLNLYMWMTMPQLP